MNISELLTDLSIHYNSIIRNVASQLQLTTSQAYHLFSIPTDGIPMSRLASKLGLDTSTLTRNIQKLERLGLIERQADSYDRRVQNAVLTDKGIEVVDSLEEKLLNINFSITEQIDLDSQENMADILEKLVWAMDCIREK